MYYLFLYNKTKLNVFSSNLPFDSEISDQPVDIEISDQSIDSEISDQHVDSEIRDQPVDSEISKQPVDRELSDQPVDFVLRFYGPVNPMESCRARSVYLTTHGRFSPLSG